MNSGNMQENLTSEGPPSNYHLNKNMLLETIMNRLEITNEDLHKETSYIKSIIRDEKINEVID